VSRLPAGEVRTARLPPCPVRTVSWFLPCGADSSAVGNAQVGESMSIKIRLANCSGPSRATSVAPRTDALQVTDRGTLSETGRNPGGAVRVTHHEGELTVDDLVSEIDQAAGGGKNRVGFRHQLLGQRSSHDLLVRAVHDRTRSLFLTCGRPDHSDPSTISLTRTMNGVMVDLLAHQGNARTVVLNSSCGGDCSARWNPPLRRTGR
jgi:hypothetical protein